MSETLTSSTFPPTLPLPRQPSPLSLSSGGHGEYFTQSSRSSPVPSVFESEDRSAYEVSDISHQHTPTHFPVDEHQRHDGPSRINPNPDLIGRSSGREDHGIERMPIRPVPDSLIYRTTLKQLESQTVTLKRLSKQVLSSLSTVTGIYDQLISAEDELLGSLGEMSRWLGHGYGLGSGIWDEEIGVRKYKKERRRREKEDLEVMVAQSVDNVRGELKRRGLAGGGATSRYEVRDQVPRALCSVL